MANLSSLLYLVVSVVGVFLVQTVKGHGRLIDPPARNVLWNYGYNNPANVDLNQLNCGGTSTQWSSGSQAVGQCGLCGDPYSGPRLHEAGYPGNTYANGIIGRVYKSGETITVTVAITANHFGWFQFSICEANYNERLTQSCFRNLTAPGVYPQETLFPISELLPTSYKGNVDVVLQLPAGLVCSQCVIQWFWYAGNSVGQLPQETFINCADVTITKPDGTLDGTGLTMPRNISPKAYKPTPKPNHTYGEARTIGLSPGEWDCEASALIPDAKKRVNRGWCIENCLYAQPSQRSCPVDVCKCYKEGSSEESDRRELGVTEPYPRVDGNGNLIHARQGVCDGEWQCRAQPPYTDAVYLEWCMNNCVRAHPSQINCSFQFCNCWMVGRQLSQEQVSTCLQPSTTESTNIGHEERTTPAPHQGSLRGDWTCKVVSPYDSYSSKITADYKSWCDESCIKQTKEIRLCVTTVCHCYRTDQVLTVRETRIQLGDSAYDLNQRGVVDDSPAQLNRISGYYVRTQDYVKESKVLDWDCDPLHSIPHARGAMLKRSEHHRWCLSTCLRNINEDGCGMCRCYQVTPGHTGSDRQLLNQSVDASQIIHLDPEQVYHRQRADDQREVAASQRRMMVTGSY